LTGKAILDGDYEQRLKLERRLARELLPILAKQQAVARPKRGEKDASGAIERIQKFTPQLKSAVRNIMIEVAMLGLDTSMAGKRMPDEVVDTNDIIRDWIDAYTFTLVTNINETTAAYLQKRIAKWVNEELTLDDLIKDFEPIFGKRRAELIASTEVTRAYAQGRLMGWKANGMADKEPLEMPPAHPRCRCILTQQRRGDEWHFIWKTAVDDRVCPICGPRHNQSMGVARVVN
jgi:hypothetical protein